MSGAMEQNRFAPPRAQAEDSVEAEVGPVEAGRGSPRCAGANLRTIRS